MAGKMKSQEQFIKLSHFDRIRRGYFDKIPLNFIFIGATIAVNVFGCTKNSSIIVICAIAMHTLGAYLKESILEMDDIELNQNTMEIEQEFRKR